MKLLMISGDRSVLAGKKGAFHYTLEEFRTHWERIDVVCPRAERFQVASGKLQVASDERETCNLQPATFSLFQNVFFHPSPWGLPRQPRWILEKGSELYAAHRHDVMTVHDYPPFYNGRGALRLKRVTGIPAASEIHHLVGYPKPASFTEAVGKIMTRWQLPALLRRFDGVRVVNKHVGAQLAAWGVEGESITVVPSFYLDTGLIASLGGTPEPEYDVVFCGRMVENKGIEPLLHAVAHLPDAKLLLIGDGPLRGSLQKLAGRLGLKNRARFAGWLPTQKDVLEAIRSAKMLVMNSTSEGGPRVVLEAMACGVPVIVTRVGVMEEVIEDGKSGLFTTGDSKDLERKISQLLRDAALRKRLGSTGKQSVARFERGAAIKAYADFLKSLA